MSNLLYPYDPTGTAITNRVVTEIDLPRVRNRAFAPDGAPFYKDSVSIVVKSTGVPLPKSAYEVLRLNPIATATTNKSVASIINITDLNFYGKLLTTVQAVGGPELNNSATIQKMLDLLASDGRTVKFSELIDAPVTMPPSPHLTYVGDMYGAKSLVDALDRITASNDHATEVTIELLNSRYDRIFQIINNLSETGGSAGLDIELLKQQVANNLLMTTNSIKQLTGTVGSQKTELLEADNLLRKSITEIGLTLNRMNTVDSTLTQTLDLLRTEFETYVEDTVTIISELRTEISKVAITMQGPKIVYQGDMLEWTLTNYDSFSSYTLTTTLPDFQLKNDKLILNLPIDVEPGIHDFQISKDSLVRNITLNILPRYVVKPTITWAVNGQEDVTLSPNLTLSEYVTVPLNTDPFGSVQWQFAMDEEFTSLVSDEEYTTIAPTVRESLPLETDLFVRARVKGSLLAYSEWSPTVSFKTVGIEPPQVSISGSTYGANVDGDTRYTHTFSIATSTYVGGGTHSASQFIVTDINGDVLLDSGEVTGSSLRQYIPYDNLTVKFDSDAIIFIKSRYKNNAGAWGPYSIEKRIALATRTGEEVITPSPRYTYITYTGNTYSTVPRPPGQTQWNWSVQYGDSEFEQTWSSVGSSQSATPPKITYWTQLNTLKQTTNSDGVTSNYTALTSIVTEIHQVTYGEASMYAVFTTKQTLVGRTQKLSSVREGTIYNTRTDWTEI